MSILQALFAFASLFLRFSLQATLEPCVSQNYPLGTGDLLTASVTSYYSIDVDSYGNVAAGGQTTGSSLCGSAGPIVDYISAITGYRWGQCIKFTGGTSNYVAAIKFTNDFSKIAVVLNKPLSTEKLRILYLKSSDGTLTEQYYESLPNPVPSESSLIYPNSLLHDSDDNLFIAMALYNQWTLIKIKLSGETASSVTKSYMFQQTSNSSPVCSRAMGIISDGDKIYVSGLFLDSDSGKCNSGAVILVEDDSSYDNVEFGWSISHRDVTTAGNFFFIEHIEKKKSTSSDHAYIWGCGYKDTSFTSTPSSNIVAAFVKYKIEDDDYPLPSDSEIFYYDSSANTLNQDSKCLQISTKGYGVVLNLVSGTGAMRSHILQFGTDFSSPNRKIYKFDGNFEYSGNYLRHAKFTSDGDHYFFAGDLKQGGSTSYSNTFGFLMYLPISTGAFSDSCLTFSTITYSNDIVQLTEISDTSEMQAYNNGDLSSWIIKSNSDQFDKTTDITSVAMTISSTLSDNRIVCASSGRQPSIQMSVSQLTYTCDIGSSLSVYYKSVTVKTYRDTTTTASNECQTNIAFTMTPTDLPSTIYYDSTQEKIKWSSTTTLGTYNIKLTGVLDNSESAFVDYGLMITNGCSSTPSITAPLTPFTATIVQFDLDQTTPVVYNMNSFTIGTTTCTITQSVEYQDGTSISGTPFSFSGSQFTISPFTDESMIKTHNLRLKASASTSSVSVNFSVTLGKSECLQATLSVLSAAADQVFSSFGVSSTVAESVVLPTYSSSQTESTCGAWTYKGTIIKDSIGNTVDTATSQVFNWDTSYTTLIFYNGLSSSLYSGPYTITVQAYQGPYSGQSTISETFTVTLTSVCTVTSLSVNSLDVVSGTNEMAPQEYTIGNSALQIKVNPFIQDLDCRATVTYTLSVQGMSVVPSFIKGSFSSSTGGTITVSSTKRSDASKPIMTLVVTATITAKQTGLSVNPTATLNIPLIIKVENKGPPVFASDPQSILMSVGQTVSWKLPSYSDPDSADKVSADVTLGSASSFITGSFPSFTIKPTSNTDHVGTFPITMTLKDDNPTSQSTTYTVNLVVSAGAESSTNTNDSSVAAAPPINTMLFSSSAIKQRQNRKSAPPKNPIELKATLTSVSDQGMATIAFNVPIFEISNLTWIDKKVLQIKVLPGVDSDPELVKIVQWNVTSFKPREMKIKLVFANLMYVSRYSTPEKLQVVVVNNEFFINEETFMPIKNLTTLINKIPKQLPQTTATAMLQSASGPTASTMNSVMISNLAVNLVMAASLQFLWGMINVMQLIVNMPLLNVQFPSNALLFYKFIQDMSNFDVIPTEWIQEQIFSFTDDKQEETQYNSMGYQSTSIVENLGSMMLYLFGLIGLVIFVLLIKFLRNRYQWINKIYTYLYDKIFYNMILRLFLEGYIQYSISSMMNLQHLTWSNSSNTFSSIFAIIIFACIFIFPFFVWWILWSRPSIVLNQAISKVRFGSVYLELKTENKAALLYNVFYMLRRLLFAFIAIIFEEDSFMQIQILVFHCILLIIYNKMVKPFEQQFMNTLEVFNECCIIAAAYHLFVFTEYVEDPELQFKFGWSIIGVTTFNIVVNMLVMIHATCQKVKGMFKKLQLKYQAWKIKKSQVKKQVYVVENKFMEVMDYDQDVKKDQIMGDEQFEKRFQPDILETDVPVAVRQATKKRRLLTQKIEIEAASAQAKGIQSLRKLQKDYHQGMKQEVPAKKTLRDELKKKSKFMMSIDTQGSQRQRRFSMAQPDFNPENTQGSNQPLKFSETSSLNQGTPQKLDMQFSFRQVDGTDSKLTHYHTPSQEFLMQESSGVTLDPAVRDALNKLNIPLNNTQVVAHLSAKSLFDDDNEELGNHKQPTQFFKQNNLTSTPEPQKLRGDHRFFFRSSVLTHQQQKQTHKSILEVDEEEQQQQNTQE